MIASMIKLIFILALMQAFTVAVSSQSRERLAKGGVMTQDNVVSGTVTYTQEMKLPATAVVIVRLMKVSRSGALPEQLAEQRIETGGKQGPFSFDVAYDRLKVVERGLYAIQAEIRDGDRLLFITDRGVPVITAGNPRVVKIVVAPVGQQAASGRALNLSKYGTGSLEIGRDRLLIVRAVVKIDANNRATVTLSGIDASTAFSGKATYLDAKTIRVDVNSSGTRRAGGTIEIRFTGRTLTSVTSRNLTLEGQAAAVRF